MLDPEKQTKHKQPDKPFDSQEGNTANFCLLLGKGYSTFASWMSVRTKLTIHCLELAVCFLKISNTLDEIQCTALFYCVHLSLFSHIGLILCFQSGISASAIVIGCCSKVARRKKILHTELSTILNLC